MAAYYNEIDKKAAAWLRELIKAGAIAPGDVDERSIADVKPHELRGYTQCHFFAGVGIWSYALRNAGWADSTHVWTGSCPCQPFSAAGKGGGFDDERHLWPAFHYLIEQCRPAVVFGEQVASKAVDAWVDLVCSDMEALGHAFTAVPFPASSVGAPHIRDRTYWTAAQPGALADAYRQQRNRRRIIGASGRTEFANGSSIERLADASSAGIRAEGSGAAAGTSRSASGETGEQRFWADLGAGGAVAIGLADAYDAGLEGRLGVRERAAELSAGPGSVADSASIPGPTNGFWGTPDWLLCRDGKWRPVESGTQPLVASAPARVGRLRGYGNGINAEAARVWIEACLETAQVEGVE